MLLSCAPALLRRALARTGQSVERMTLQIVLALIRGSSASLYFYERGRRGFWRQTPAVGAVCGYAGRNGLAADKREGDGCTPEGLFKFGYAFGCREKPETAMPYRLVREGCFWVDDPGSPLYNTWAERENAGLWRSAERLWEQQERYAYAVVIEYNTTPAAPGKGSAIFLHCGTGPTSGCIAVPERAMLDILKWLDPAKKPAILIAAG